MAAGFMASDAPVGLEPTEDGPPILKLRSAVRMQFVAAWPLVTIVCAGTCIPL